MRIKEEKGSFAEPFFMDWNIFLFVKMNDCLQKSY